MSTTKAQQRSAYALQELKNLNCNREKFKPFIAGLPSMILQNGLGQALAFLQAKGRDEHQAGFAIIVKWLRQEKILSSDIPLKAVEELSKLSQQQYLCAQGEGLKVLEWVKRYANSDLFG